MLLGPTGAQHNRRDGNQLGCAHGRQLDGPLHALPVHGPPTLTTTALAKLRVYSRGTVLHTRWSKRRPDAVTMHATTQTVLRALQDGDTTLNGVLVRASIRLYICNKCVPNLKSCTPAGSYISLSEFAAQYCNYERDPYSASWYARGQRRVVRRPVSRGPVRVRVPATRSNNEFVITYTANDASGNSASCNFTASLQVDCKATPLPDEEVQSMPVGSLGGWPSTEASDSVTVPCGATVQGTKRRACDPRGTWAQHPDLSACSESRSDTVATLTFAIATNYSLSSGGPI